MLLTNFFTLFEIPQI